MRKRLLVVLAICATLMVLSACGKTGQDTSLQPVDPGNAAAGAVDNTQTDESVNQDAKNNAEADDQAVQETEAQVLVDDAFVYIEFIGVDEDFMGPELKFSIENRSGMEICVQANNLSVNGYMIDPIMSADIMAGKKSLESMSMFSSDLEEIGVNSAADIENIEWTFHIFDNGTWDTIEDVPVALNVG